MFAAMTLPSASWSSCEMTSREFWAPQGETEEFLAVLAIGSGETGNKTSETTCQNQTGTHKPVCLTIHI